MSIDRAVVARRLRAIQDLLDHLDTLSVTDADSLSDMGLRLQVERVLTQVVNLAGEVNAHLALAVLKRPPEDFRQGFDLAARAGFIPPDLADALKPSVGLRSVLTHEDVDIDLNIVAAALPTAKEQYGVYVQSVARALAAET